KRLSFSLKVAVRNLFRYKKRFWMTVIGIGGCTALIIVGFGLRDSILSVVDRQYVELNHYESQVALTDDTTLEERQDVEEGLGKDENVAGFLPCYQVAVTVENAAGSMDATVFAAEDAEKLPDFVTLRDRAHHEPVPVREDGMVVTEKMAKVLDIKVGDKVTLDDGDRRFEVEVSGITENYLSHFLYGTQDYYNRQYGEERVSNLYLCRYVTDTPQAEDEVAARMMQYSGVTAMSSSSAVKDAFAGSIESVDYAVLIIIIAAAALALVVLYNLTNINITERIRELATLKVLGFYDGELSAYVYRENIFLTIFGILAGLLMGFFLHRYVITTVEIDMLMFVHSAKPLSYL
ncbi:MAG: FtsX-like permease family protein, partial [Oscillospiraceae bacterium]